mgnify:CR=1 FL=1
MHQLMRTGGYIRNDEFQPQLAGGDARAAYGREGVSMVNVRPQRDLAGMASALSSLST